ncbi:MAG: ABC1 kinase family protein [Gaiellaceae bacterium]
MAQTQSRNLGRLSEIAQVATRHGFGYLFENRRFRRRHPDDETPSQRGAHLRAMFDELGPTFVKFGQLLSTRPDILPPDIIAELRALQDDVTPFSSEEAASVIQEDLGLPIERLFLEFEPTPLAAASIGQVHRAILPNGRRVAVKVQRPDAPRQIEADIALLYQAARLAKDRLRRLDFIDARGIVDEFARNIRQELDYRGEARNADRFRHDFAGHPHVRIPRVYWSYTRARVLTLEFIDGVQLADVDPLTTSVVERRNIAELMTETWMTMVFRNGFFHGDPHPANILVLPNGQGIGLVDFGLAGKLTDGDMSKLTRLFIDAANENVDALPKRLAELGVRYPREREAEFQAALRELFYRYYGAPLSQIDPLQVIRDGFDLIYSMSLELPTRWLLLDKAIATLASVGVELYPEFNVFEVAKPYARNLMIGRYSPQRVMGRARREGTDLVRIGRELPYQLHDVLEQVRDGQVEVGFVHKGVDEFLVKLDEAMNRIVVAVVVATGVLSSALLGIFADKGPHLWGLHIFAFFGFVLSGILMVWLLVGVLRHGRL